MNFLLEEAEMLVSFNKKASKGVKVTSCFFRLKKNDEVYLDIHLMTTSPLPIFKWTYILDTHQK